VVKKKKKKKKKKWLCIMIINVNRDGSWKLILLTVLAPSILAPRQLARLKDPTEFSLFCVVGFEPELGDLVQINK